MHVHKPSVAGMLPNAVRRDDPAVEIFRQAIRELGYFEGRELRIEFRTAQRRADRLPGWPRNWCGSTLM